MTQNVPIVMTMDENYVIPTKVAIWSVLRTIKKDYKVKIYILCNALLEQKYRADIVSLEKRNANVSISFLEVDSKIFNKAKTTGHIPVASYYRLQIPKLLNEDKCFFILENEKAVATITVVCDYDKKVGLIHMVACREDARGKGYGTLLTKIAEYTLKKEGMESAYLTTDDWRIPAIKSYLRIGFYPDLSNDDFINRWDLIYKQIRR